MRITSSSASTARYRSLHRTMATITTPPATLQPCKHARARAVRSHPRARRRYCQVIRSAASSRSGSAAMGGRPETTPACVSTAVAGDMIRRLQNGPDVRGVALEGEKGRVVDLTPLAVELIGESFGEWLQERHEEERDQQVRVSVGKDPRLSGSRLSAALFGGLARAGCAVFDMGLATTPACFMSTILPGFGYDASIMMTASHLPYTRNGLKFFIKRGGLTSGEVEGICDRAAHKYAARRMGIGGALGMPPVVMRVNLMSAYGQHLRNIIKEGVAHPTHFDTPLKGFKIIVNSGNGCGGFFTWDVLEKLGADTTGSLHLEPDGTFPNHMPNPEDATAMSLTRGAVLSQGADLGVVFDTDVDRSGVVDAMGAAINGDRLIALISAIALREHPGTTVVTDARAGDGLTRFIEARGGHHCLYRVGYRNVIDKGVQLNSDGVETHVMMETTGHGALKENHFLDDGAYMVVKIIIEMVRMRLAGLEGGVGSIIKDLEEPAESVLLRMDIVGDVQDAKQRGIQVVETFKNYIEEGKLHGWVLDDCGDCSVDQGCLVDTNEHPIDVDAYMYRAKFCDESRRRLGWVHIRQSVHNPNMALNMQSCISGGCKSMARDLFDRFLLASGVHEFVDVTQTEGKLVTDQKIIRGLKLFKLPGMFGAIPVALTRLFGITELTVSRTGVSGPVLPFLRALTVLTSLDLSFNSLSGAIPPPLGMLLHLIRVNLSRNHLTGSIPSLLLSKAGPEAFLALSHNNLSGSIPAEFAAVQFIQIDLSRNRLTGDASAVFGRGNKPLLTSVDLSRNALSFDMSGLRLTERLDVSHNMICGGIPAQVANLSSTLQLFNVSYNRLCGEVPSGAAAMFHVYSFQHAWDDFWICD